MSFIHVFESNTTPFMILLAAFKILLFRYSNQEDIIIGTPIANRNRKETENIIGFFSNNLLIRSDLSGNPAFNIFLKQIKQIALNAFAHQEIPFEKIVEFVNPKRDMSHSPLFQVMFIMQNIIIPDINLTGIRSEEIKLDNGFSKFDLTLELWENKNSLSACF